MRTLPTTLLLLGSLALAAPTATRAQETDRNDAAALRALVTQPSAADRDRDAVGAFLLRPDVRAAASTRGIDVEALAERVVTLDSADAADLAERVRDTEQQLAQAGGDTFVITSTTIIIALLIIILVIVA